MAETPEAPHTHEGGFKHFMTATTGPLPNWVWLLVIGGTLGAVYIVPKFFGGTSASSSNSNTPAPSSLAIDPTTGLPYATEGLIPAGGSISPGNGSSNDYSALYNELQTIEQQLQQQQSSPSGNVPPFNGILPGPVPGVFQPGGGGGLTINPGVLGYLRKLQAQNPGASWGQVWQIYQRQLSYVNSLKAANPGATDQQLQQIMQSQQIWRAVEAWQNKTGQTWTGPKGSAPEGYGYSGPGVGVIQSGTFHYINPPAA